MIFKAGASLVWEKSKANITVRRDKGPGEPLEDDEDQKVPQKKIMDEEKPRTALQELHLQISSF